MKFVNSINEEAEVLENPINNPLYSFFKQVPVLRVPYSELSIENLYGCDPDIEIVVCDTLEEARELISKSFLEVAVGKDGGMGLLYDVYETSKGFVVTFIDVDLSFGGNIIKDYQNQDCDRVLYDCHFTSNRDELQESYLEERHEHLTPEQIQFWKDLFKELDS